LKSRLETAPATARSTPPSRARPWLPLVDGVLLVVIALMLVLTAWLRGPSWVYLPIGDEANHFLNLMSAQESLLGGEGPWARFRPLVAWTDPHAYPPVGYVLPALLGALAGGLPQSGLPVQQVGWMVLVVLGTYVLGRQVFGTLGGGGRHVGVLAALLVAFAPTLVGYLSAPLLDLAATATTLVALTTLAWNLEPRGAVAACAMGGAVAVAFLTKWTAILVLAPALMAVALANLRGRPRSEVLAGFGLVAFVVLGIAVPFLLLQGQRPILDPMLEWPLPRSIAIVLVNLVGVGWIARLLADRLGACPTRSLVLGALVAALLVAPFLLWNQDAMARRLARHSDDQAAARIQVHGQMTRPLPHLWGEPGNLLEFSLGSLALLGLAFRGPRGSLALLVGPILMVAVLSRDPALPDYRYSLPAVPLLVLALVGWLQGMRVTRVASTTLLLALGLFHMARWLSGSFVPCQPGHHVEPGNLGTGPASLHGQVARLADAVARQTGPDPEAVWTVVRAPLLYPNAGQSDSPQEAPGRSPVRRTFHDSIQISALARGHALVVRGVLEEGATRVTPADLSVIRILSLRRSRASLERLHDLATADAERIRQGWFLVLGPPGQPRFEPPLPGTLGPVTPLPSVEGLEARLYPFTAHRPLHPQTEAGRAQALLARPGGRP